MLGVCVSSSSHMRTFVHTPHWSSTSPLQLQVPEAIPPPSHTPQRSTTLPLFATLSHPAQLELSPPHTPHASATSPPQLHLPAGMPEPPHTYVCVRVCHKESENENTKDDYKCNQRCIESDYSISDHEQACVLTTRFLATTFLMVSQGFTHYGLRDLKTPPP